MPKVINNSLYAAPGITPAAGSVAAILNEFGGALFGKDAAQAAALRANGDYYGVQADAGRQKIMGRQGQADASMRGDTRGGVAAALLSGDDPRLYGRGVLVQTANDPTITMMDPRISKAQIGAGESVVATPFGQSRALANAATTTGMNNATTLRANDMTTDRVARAAQYKHDNTPTTVYVDGVPKIVSQADAVGGGYEGAPLHKDQVVGQIVQRAMQPAAPRSPGLSGLDPDIRHLAGLKTGTKQFIDPETNQIFLSQDDGATVNVAGNLVPVQGTRLRPIGQEASLVRAQDDKTLRDVSAPLPPSPRARLQAGYDASKAAGLDSAIQNEFNKTLGFFTGLEAGADTNRGRENLELLSNDTVTALANMGGARDSVQGRKWIKELTPEAGFFFITGASGDEQENKVNSLVKYLRGTYAIDQENAMNPNLPPADREKYAISLRNLAKVIQRWEAPAKSPKTAAQASMAPAAEPKPESIDLLRSKPGLARQFDRRYGAGSAAKYLGGQ